MAAVPPPPARRRARPGSLDRPVNGRLYRGTWLLVGLPLLVLAFSVARPAALQPPNVPPAFDAADARTLAADLALTVPSRVPGRPAPPPPPGGSRASSRRTATRSRGSAFTAEIPGRGRIPLVNLVAEKTRALAQDDRRPRPPRRQRRRPGRERQRLRHGRPHRARAGIRACRRGGAPAAPVLAPLPVHRRRRPSAGSARPSSPPTRPSARTSSPSSTSTRSRATALPRLELTGDTPRSPSASLVETVRAQLAAETRSEPSRPSALRQLVDLGFPFSPYEQAPFVARGVPAVTITTGGDRPAARAGEGPDTLSGARLGQVGRATQNVVDALEQGIALSSGPSSYVYLGSRVVRGWAIEIVLVAMLLPFLVADRRPLRALPPPAHPDRTGAPQLPQPPRLLGLVRRRLRPLRRRGRLGGRRRQAAVARQRQLAHRRPHRARHPRGARLDRLPPPAHPAPARPPGGAARRAHGRPPRARRRRPPHRGDEPVRAPLPPAVAARVALAAAGARARLRSSARRC